MENRMQGLLLWVGRVAGIMGVLICAVAIAFRLTGHFWVLGFQAGTLLQAGNTLMLVGCLSYMAVIAGRK